MKALKYMFMAATLSISVSSCHDLDLEPKGLVQEQDLYSNEKGVVKYFTLLYQDLPIEDFNYKHTGNAQGYATVNQEGWHSGNKWQAQKGSPAVCAMEATGWGEGYGNGFGYWPYDRIRDINAFLVNFEEYKENYDEATYKHLVAEARFLRGYYYFGLVKRYGGVPIVSTVLDPKQPADALKILRSTEYDSWKFIYEDLKYAMDNCSTNKDEKNRANRYSAAALMSRAMLYAGSIAKYNHYIGITGPAVDAGLMGIPADKAKEFFQYAYDAAKVVAEGGYALHNGSNKEQACVETMLQNTEEDIMIKEYGLKETTPDKTSLKHCWDALILPSGPGLALQYGSHMMPAWDMIKLYEFPEVTDADDKPIRFDSLDDLWNNDEIEPRCKANFFFPGMTDPCSGVKFDILGGVYTSYPGTATDGTAYTPGSESAYTKEYRITATGVGQVKEIDGKKVKISGIHGRHYGSNHGPIHAGCCIRKYVTGKGSDPKDRTLFGSHQTWKVFRYAEVLLNRAEAAYELGLINNDDNLKKEAIGYINEIRERAGAHEYTYKANPTDVGTSVYGFAIDENLQYIRDERARELCYENQRIFDLRRWRVADIMFLNGKYTRVLQPYHVLDEDKYIFLTEVDKPGTNITFDKKWYYEQIPAAELAKNPDLIRNDGY